MFFRRNVANEDIPGLVEEMRSGLEPSPEAWERFTRLYTPLLLHVARKNSGSYDEAMDAYACILERLRDADYRRLRSFSKRSGIRFTTWLVVVAKRICIDYHRVRLGRASQRDGAEGDVSQLRQRLAGLRCEVDVLGKLPDESAEIAETLLERLELSEQLATLRTMLDPADKLLLLLRFERGLSGAQIAATLSYPSAFHVYRRINRILCDLKARLEEKGYDKNIS